MLVHPYYDNVIALILFNMAFLTLVLGTHFKIPSKKVIYFLFVVLILFLIFKAEFNVVASLISILAVLSLLYFHTIISNSYLLIVSLISLGLLTLFHISGLTYFSEKFGIVFFFSIVMLIFKVYFQHEKIS